MRVPARANPRLVQESVAWRSIRGEQLRSICLDDHVRIRKISLVDPRVDVVDATGRVVGEVRAVRATSGKQFDRAQLRMAGLGTARVWVETPDVRQPLRRWVGACVIAIRQLLLADLSESPGEREGSCRPAGECDDDARMRRDLYGRVGSRRACEHFQRPGDPDVAERHGPEHCAGRLVDEDRASRGRLRVRNRNRQRRVRGTLLEDRHAGVRVDLRDDPSETHEPGQIRLGRLDVDVLRGAGRPVRIAVVAGPRVPEIPGGIDQDVHLGGRSSADLPVVQRKRAARVRPGVLVCLRRQQGV